MALALAGLGGMVGGGMVWVGMGAQVLPLEYQPEEGLAGLERGVGS